MFSTISRIMMTIQDMEENQQFIIIDENWDEFIIDVSVFNVGAYWEINEKSASPEDVLKLWENSKEFEIRTI